MLEKQGESMTLLNWKITLLQYLEKAIPDTDSTYVNHTMWGATNAAKVTVEDLRTHKKKTDWISAGNFQFSPRAIHLDDEHTLVMAPAEARKFQSDVLIYQKDHINEVLEEKIEVNHPISVGGWRIYQLSYDERMGALVRTQCRRTHLRPLVTCRLCRNFLTTCRRYCSPL